MNCLGTALLATMTSVFAAVGVQLIDERGMYVALILAALCPLMAFMEHMVTGQKSANTTTRGAASAFAFSNPVCGK